MLIAVVFSGIFFSFFSTITVSPISLLLNNGLIMSEVNGNMILLARESRGWTQAQLAGKMDTTQSNITKMEHAEHGTNEEWTAKIAEATGYPLSFFYQKGGIIPENLNYRRREKVAQSILSPLNAQMTIYRLQIETITAALNIPAIQLPVLEVTEEATPQAIAQKLLQKWHVPKGSVANLTDIIEGHGIVVNMFDFGTARVDSRCLISENGIPIIFMNSSLLGDRQRFSLAYQLGHLIMHTSSNISWDRDTGHEANLFAAELLMPEKDIRADFEQGISLPLLGNLKKKWKVSMIALLYRADDLGYVTPQQKKALVQQFNDRQIRRREPVELDVPLEQPRLLRQWLSQLKSERRMNTSELAAMLHLQANEFVALYNY
ncbi:MAG TPA: XRE family transcriptional regulator [Flavipsychrobacter sp.]|nr:XRE family transcriptional regulator [Flavipsychrobacter sp.]